MKTDQTGTQVRPDARAELAPQDISRDALVEKYAKGKETTIDEVRRRVARALAQVEPEDKRAHWERRFLQAQEDGFIPAGRINSAAGIADAGHADQLLRAAGRRLDLRGRRRQARHLHRAAGGGRDHAPRRRRRLRLLLDPARRAREVKGTHSRASGPVSYMRVFDRSCETVESAGARRGAQMGVLRCDHPDIEEFIHAKDQGDLTNFNISVGVTDDFMQAVEKDERRRAGAQGRSPGRTIRRRRYQRDDGMWVYRKVRGARAVGADHALDLRPRRAGHPVPRPHEPRQQPELLRDHRGHQSLRRAAAAALRLLLPGLDRPDALRQACPSASRPRSTSSASAEVVEISVRMLDNVLDVTAWPLEQQHKEAMDKRRVGLGFTGLGDALIMLRLRYDTDEARAMAARHLRGDARRGLSRLGRAGARARRLPAVQRRPVPVRHQLRLAPARRRSRRRSASTACATATCCRSRPPAPSAWPSPTTPPTASSRRSPGPTRARSACPTARMQGIPGRGPRLAPVQGTWAATWRSCRDVLRHRAGDLRHGAREMVAAVAPYIDTASPRPSTCRRTIRMRTSRISTSRPGSPG